MASGVIIFREQGILLKGNRNIVRGDEHGIMLDDLKLMEQSDTGGMLKLVYNLPDHCEEAFEMASDAVKGLRLQNILNVVITGLGGSAIGGNLIRMFVTDKASIPVTVNRDYTLPSFVDEKTLVIACSYSGNTEETLSAYDDARRKKARILVVSTGGELKQKALSDEVPMISVPAGLPPRAALGYSFIPLLVVTEGQGIVSKRHADISPVIDMLRVLRDEIGPKVPESNNAAKRLARRIFGKLPVIYGVSGLTDVLAERWKGQINENGKHPAFFNTFPELNHNEIMGYEGDPQILNNFELIILRSPGESERMKKRIEITGDLIREHVGGITEIMPQGNTVLEQMFYHIMYADYVSCYLCFLNEKDPTEIDLIDELKDKLQ